MAWRLQFPGEFVIGHRDAFSEKIGQEGIGALRQHPLPQVVGVLLAKCERFVGREVLGRRWQSAMPVEQLRFRDPSPVFCAERRPWRRA